MFMYKVLPLSICFIALSLVCDADEFEWSDMGLRVGLDVENSIDVQSYEWISTLDTPWSWSPGENFEIDLGLELGLGVLNGEGETGILAHVGPSLAIEMGDLPLEFVISSGPALLSEDTFDTLDLGGSFQFMSAIGFDLEVIENWNLGYRFLHISNAGLHDKNPGMNLHALTLLYKF